MAGGREGSVPRTPSNYRENNGIASAIKAAGSEPRPVVMTQRVVLTVGRGPVGLVDRRNRHEAFSATRSPKPARGIGASQVAVRVL